MREPRFYILRACDNTGETAEGPMSKAEAIPRVQREPELPIVITEQLHTISHRSVWPAAANYVRSENDELISVWPKAVKETIAPEICLLLQSELIGDSTA